MIYRICQRESQQERIWWGKRERIKGDRYQGREKGVNECSKQKQREGERFKY